MSSSLHDVSRRYPHALAHASTACTGRAAPPTRHVDFPTGFCGLSLPALFKRIGTTTADGQPAKTTPTIIASGPAERLGNRRRMTLGKPSNRPVFHRSIGREPMSARAGPVAHVKNGNRSNSGGTDECMRSRSAGE